MDFVPLREFHGNFFFKKANVGILLLLYMSPPNTLQNLLKVFYISKTLIIFNTFQRKITKVSPIKNIE